MAPEELIKRFHEYAHVAEDTVCDADSLIGFFQMFRPDGKAIENLFDDLPGGDELCVRLDELYCIAGDDRRPDSGRDAYFVVRRPQPVSVDSVTQATEQWLHGVRDLALELGKVDVAKLLDPLPTVRVLEGHAPKHPKQDNEKCDLLKALQKKVPEFVNQINGASPFAEILRPAYYFIACDSMLRDYLMWPFYADATKVPDPFAAYFRIWKHGAKYRIFGNSQIDLYLPRQAG